MDKRFTKKSIEEYIDKLRTISEQAKHDEKKHVSNFIDMLLEKKVEDIELLDFIYQSADELSEELVNVYILLLNHSMSLEWYVAASFIHEERDSISKYFPIMIECVKNQMDVNLFQGIVYETDSFEKFKAEIEKHLDSGEDLGADEKSFIGHLKAENSELKVQLASIFEELKYANHELTKANETVFAVKSELHKYETENKKLKTENHGMSVAHVLLEKKFEQEQIVNAQLEKVNNYLQNNVESGPSVSDKVQVEFDKIQVENEELRLRVNEMEITILKLEEQLIEKDSLIESLQTNISDYELRIHDYEAQAYSLTYAMDGPGGGVDYFTEEELYVSDPVISEPRLEHVMVEEQIGVDSTEELIDIKDNSTRVVEHTNIFANIFLNHQKKKFLKKSDAEQQNMIFLKMMELNFSKNLVQTIKDTMKNTSVSKADIYFLISKPCSEEEIIKFCAKAA